MNLASFQLRLKGSTASEGSCCAPYSLNGMSLGLRHPRRKDRAELHSLDEAATALRKTSANFVQPSTTDFATVNACSAKLNVLVCNLKRPTKSHSSSMAYLMAFVVFFRHGRQNLSHRIKVLRARHLQVSIYRYSHLTVL